MADQVKYMCGKHRVTTEWILTMDSSELTTTPGSGQMHFDQTLEMVHLSPDSSANEKVVIDMILTYSVMGSNGQRVTGNSEKEKRWHAAKGQWLKYDPWLQRGHSLCTLGCELYQLSYQGTTLRGFFCYGEIRGPTQINLVYGNKKK